MIRFIDVKTGNVYNGSKPYVHWFEGKQSVGINYDKQFVFLTEDDCVDITINSEVFSIVDNHKIGFFTDDEGRPVEKEVYGKNYLNLDVLKTNHIQHIAFQGEGIPGSISYKYPFDVTGDDGTVYHLYTFNIIAQGKYVGQITDVFTINGEEFSIGADFYDENEILSINLANFGMDMSNEVQRAIYESNINEQKANYVLLNRKFKELLNEYINIIGNKGSYKSLINSLRWFEYGDLTKIYEYWKHSEPNKDYLSKKDLVQFIDESTQDLINSNSKTTYIGISTALNKILKSKNGDIVYQNDDDAKDVKRILNEPIPCLEDVSMLWAQNEMALKMTLLHNFFATYFLPIHLDLIHTTIEKTIYSDTLKINNFHSLNRLDIHDELDSFTCEVGKLFHLDNVETFTNLTTPFGYINSHNLGVEDGMLDIIGVDLEFQEYDKYPDAVDENDNPIEYTIDEETYQYKRNSKGELITEDDVYKAYILQHYKGIGAIIPFKCTFNMRSNILTDASIIIHKDGDLILQRDTTNVNHDNIDGITHMNFNILIKEIGNYKAQLKFRRTDGFVYTKTVDFVVDEENYPEIKMFKIVPKNNIENSLFVSITEEGETNPGYSKWLQEGTEIPLELGNIADYVLSPIQHKRRYYNGEDITETPIIYTQFISATSENIKNTVHSNRVIIIKILDKNKLQELLENTNIYNNGFILTDMYSVYTSIDKTTGHCSLTPGIVWLKMNKSGAFYTPPTYDEIISKWDIQNTDDYLIGINTQFNIDDSKFPNYTIRSTEKRIKVWVRDMFIPYFYKLEELGTVSFLDRISNGYSEDSYFGIKNSPNTYVIDQNDVVCFLPKLKCVRRPSDFMWKYYCSTINKTIIPETFRRTDMDILTESVPYMSEKKNPIYMHTGGEIFEYDGNFLINLLDSSISYEEKPSGYLHTEKIGDTVVYKDSYGNIYSYDGIGYVYEKSGIKTMIAIEDDFINYFTQLYDEDRQMKVIPNDNKNTYKIPSPAILQPLFGRYDFRVLPSLGYYDIIFSYKMDDFQNKDNVKTVTSQFLVSKKGSKKVTVPDIPKTFTEPDIPVQDEIRVYLEEILRKTNSKYGFNLDYLDDYSDYIS